MTDIPVTVSDSAARRIAEIVSRRCRQKGATCIRRRWRLFPASPTNSIVVDAQADDDLVISKDGATVLIDSLSLVYMTGSEIDFVDNLLGQSFQIKNPNAVPAAAVEQASPSEARIKFSFQWLLHWLKQGSNRESQNENRNLEHQRRQSPHRQSAPVAQRFLA